MSEAVVRVTALPSDLGIHDVYIQTAAAHAAKFEIERAVR